MGKSFECHRAVLSASSTVFKRMLLSDFQESREARIIIRGADDAEVQAMLEYIYTGKLNLCLQPGSYTVLSCKLGISANKELHSQRTGSLETGIEIVNVLEVASQPEC